MKVRITPSFVVACLALVIATGGTSYAAGKINGSNIKANTVTGKQVRDGSLATADLSASARAALKGAKGDRGAAGPQGAVGSRATRATRARPATRGRPGTPGRPARRVRPGSSACPR